MAGAYLQFNRPQEALEPITRSLSLTAESLNWAQALYLLGWALRDTGEIEEAVTVLEMSVELEPTDFAHQMLAELYQTLGQEEQAALSRAKIDSLLAAR